MALKNEINVIGVVVLSTMILMPARVWSYAVSPIEIYMQARQQNYDYLQKLFRYKNVINVSDASGNTAYCYAIRYKDSATQQILVNFGADMAHSCVRKIKEENKVRAELAKRSQSMRYNYSFGEKLAGNGNNYLWWGLGALAVGGGIAVLVSGGGDGESSVTGSDEDSSGEDIETDKTPTIDEEVFQTEEYANSNLLSGVNAATAYSYMYQENEDGSLSSHQAYSDEALKKVRVGIFDTGVANNKDLEGKIVKAYDINAYNDLGNVMGHIDGVIQSYIFYMPDSSSTGGDYYFLQVENADASSPIALVVKRGLTENELEKVLAEYGLTLEDFSVMNGGGGSAPGTSLVNYFDPIDVDTWWAIVQELNHGSHVAGIIASNKNDIGSHGVAYENAEIVVASWDLSTPIYDTVKSMIDDDDVEVLSNSWGISVADSGLTAADAYLLKISDQDSVQSYAYAAANGAVWVQATGNDGASDAAIHTGMGNLDLSEYGYNGAGQYEVPFLAVTALDMSTADSYAPSGYLASYANWCGSASEYCLAAPGTNIESTAGTEEGTNLSSGTSMATPVVAGSIALLMGYYPWLSAQNVAYILLVTANNEGEYADSAKYGQGVLDLGAAVTTPIDGLRLASSSSFDSLTPVGISSLSLSSSMQNKILKLLPKTITAFDALNRPFEYDTSNLINETHTSNANFRNAVSRMAMAGKKKTIKDSRTGFAFTFGERMDNGGKVGLATMEVVNESDSGSTRFYYAENSRYDTPESVLMPTANPYLAMNDVYGAENTLNLSNTSKLRLSLQTGENGLYGRDYEQDNRSFTEQSYAFTGEYSFNLVDYLELATLGGILMENDALLGMNGTGVFGIQDTSTYYMGVKAALNLTPNLSVIAAYYRGFTQGTDTPMLAISDLQTESFMLAGEYRLNAMDKIGISLSSPLSVVKGSASLMYANGRDSYSDTVYMNKLKMSLTPEAKEYDLDLYYAGQPKEDFNLMGKVQVRFNADGEKGVTDYIGIIGVQSAF